MRGIETPVKEIRRKVFTEVAKVAYHADEYGENLYHQIEQIPYRVTKNEHALYRDNIYRERAICKERIRLAMGLSLNPVNEPVPLTEGMHNANIEEKYYEPPLMQVITAACEKCKDNVFEVSNMCRGCTAHPCVSVCPKEAISITNGKSFIDRDKCIGCGKCKAVCPYDAISKHERPCSKACGINAIGTDEYGYAKIDNEKCVSCGMCEVSCPFGAISDKSQIFQLVRALGRGQEIIAEIAPAIIGQFGDDISLKNIIASLEEIGFSKVYEVALGADIGCASEAQNYVEEVKTGELPFTLTSCCPAWAMLAKSQFPELVEAISLELTPMVATARSIKQKHPNAKVVFIGPCASKKLEASRKTIRSDVDFVITFEELRAIFDAMEVDISEHKAEKSLHDATGAGRGYAVSGGVINSIEKCINEYYPGTEVLSRHAEGLDECKQVLALAKAGKLDGYLIEGMGCPGGCVAGAGTLLDIKKATKIVEKNVAGSSRALPDKELADIVLE